MAKTPLQRGADQARRARRREAIARVRRFEAWLRAGSKLRDIPEIPTDNDYRVARAAGKKG